MGSNLGRAIPHASDMGTSGVDNRLDRSALRDRVGNGRGSNVIEMVVFPIGSWALNCCGFAGQCRRLNLCDLCLIVRHSRCSPNVYRKDLKHDYFADHGSPLSAFAENEA